MLILFFFLLGTIVGSFLNVCITRIPEGLSIVSPGSRCPRCQTPIKPYDNVPVLAWLWLRGKCRSCGLPISPMYPLIEVAMGLLFVGTFQEFGITQATIKWLFFTCLIVVLTLTDLRVRMLPDAVNWPGFAAGLMFSAVVPPDHGIVRPLAALFLRLSVPPMLGGLADALLGAAFGSFLLWGMAAAYKLVRHREGMGMGDVKMMAMVGAFLGIRGTFLTLLLGSLLGSIIGVSVVLAKYLLGWRAALAKRANRRGLGSESSLRWVIANRYQLPLGTFLGIGALATVYLGPIVTETLPVLKGILGFALRFE